MVGVHEFVDAYEPEHVVRVLLRNRGKTIDSHAEVNSLLEKVLQAARHQFPNSAHVALLTASFHCFYDKNLGLAHSLLEKARRYQGISRMERWAIFVLFREKQAMESSQISGEAMDVQTYVSFNTEFKALVSGAELSIRVIHRLHVVLVKIFAYGRRTLTFHMFAKRRSLTTSLCDEHIYKTYRGFQQIHSYDRPSTIGPPSRRPAPFGNSSCAARSSCAASSMPSSASSPAWRSAT